MSSKIFSRAINSSVDVANEGEVEYTGVLFQDKAAVNIVNDATSDTAIALNSESIESLLLHNNIAMSTNFSAPKTLYYNANLLSYGESANLNGYTLTTASRATTWNLTANGNFDETINASAIKLTSLTIGNNFNNAFNVQIAVKASNLGGVNANGILADNALLINSKINKKILVVAESKNSFVWAYGLNGGNNININNLNADIEIKTTSNNENAIKNYAYGINCKVWALVISSPINGNISVTSIESGNGDIDANGIRSGSITLGGINKNITIIAKNKSTRGSGNVLACGITASSIDINGEIKGNINVKADSFATGTMAVCGISGGGSVELSTISGKITINANSSNKLYSNAINVVSAIQSDNIILSQLNNSISVNAKGAQKFVLAYGALAGETVDFDDIKGDISIASNYTGEGIEAPDIEADAIIFKAGNVINISSISGKMTATATGKAISEAYGILAASTTTVGNVSGASTILANGDKRSLASFIKSDGDVSLNDTLSGAIKVSSISKNGNAEAYGFQGNTVKFNMINSKIDISASAGSLAKVCGISGTNGIGENTDSGSINNTITLAAKSAMNISEIYGIYSGKGSISFNNINGKITANAISNFGALSHGVYSKNEININSINNAVNINANAGGLTNAYGVRSVDKSINIQNVTNDITVSAKSSLEAVAIGFSALENINLQKLSGNIKATVSGVTDDGSNANATAISASNFTGEEINGNLTVSATGGYSSAANGIYCNVGSINISGNINSAIFVTATTAVDKSICGANGLFAAGNFSSGNITNSINIISKSDKNQSVAEAIRSNSDLTTGQISGKITVNSTGMNYTSAKGLSSNAQIVTGNLSNAISINAKSAQGEAFAAGIAAEVELTTGNISGNITVSSAGGIYSGARGILGGKVNIAGDITGDIIVSAKSTGSDSAVNSDGILAGGELIISGNINNSITVTAEAVGNQDIINPNITNAYGINSSNSFSVKKFDSVITAKATSKNCQTYAAGVFDANIFIADEVAGKITVNTIAKRSSDLTKVEDGSINTKIGSSNDGIYSSSSIKIYGELSSVITVTATTEMDCAGASGIRSLGTVEIGNITGAITSTATSKKGGATASAIGTTGWVTKFGGISGKISAKANGATFAIAYGVSSEGSITVNGSLSDLIDVTAVAGINNASAYGFKAINEAFSATEINGDIKVSASSKNDNAEAGAIYGNNEINIDKINNKIIVKATSSTETSYARGLNTSGQLTSSFIKDINVSASGNASSKQIGVAVGLKFNSLASETLELEKVTVSGTNVDVYGINAGNINDSKTIKAGINVSGNRNVYGIYLMDDSTFNILDSEIIVKGTGSLYAINSGNSIGNQDIKLQNTRIVGDIDLGAQGASADDILTITNDTNIKGNIYNVEVINFNIDNEDDAKIAMIESNDFSGVASTAFNLQITDNMTGAFVLAKDTTGGSFAETGLKAINLNLNGQGQILNLNSSVYDDFYKYSLTESKGILTLSIDYKI